MYLILSPTDKRIVHISETITYDSYNNAILDSGVRLISGIANIVEVETVPDYVVAEKYTYDVDVKTYTAIDEKEDPDWFSKVMKAIAGKQDVLTFDGLLKGLGSGSAIKTPDDDYLSPDEYATPGGPAGTARLGSDGRRVVEIPNIELVDSCVAIKTNHTITDNTEEAITCGNMEAAINSVEREITFDGAFPPSSVLDCGTNHAFANHESMISATGKFTDILKTPTTKEESTRPIYIIIRNEKDCAFTFSDRTKSVKAGRYWKIFCDYDWSRSKWIIRDSVI